MTDDESEPMLAVDRLDELQREHAVAESAERKRALEAELLIRAFWEQMEGDEFRQRLDQLSDDQRERIGADTGDPILAIRLRRHFLV